MREHSLAKVPLLLVVGKREAEEGTVAVRRLGSDEHQKVMGLDEAVALFAAEAVPPDLAAKSWIAKTIDAVRHMLRQKCARLRLAALFIGGRKP